MTNMQRMSTKGSSCAPWRQSITSTKLPAGVRPPPQAAVHLRGHLLAGAVFPCDDNGLCAALAPALPLLWLSLLGAFFCSSSSSSDMGKEEASLSESSSPEAKSQQHQQMHNTPPSDQRYAYSWGSIACSEPVQ